MVRRLPRAADPADDGPVLERGADGGRDQAHGGEGREVDHVPRASRPARAALLAQLALGPGAGRRVGGGPAAFAALRLRRLAAGLPRGDVDELHGGNLALRAELD